MKKFWLLLLCLTMALMTGVAMADEVPAELLGSWNMTSVEDEDYFPEGTTINMLFTETEITMTISVYDYTEAATMPYTVEGNTILVNDVADEYKIEGDTLWLTEEGVTIVFTREGAAPAAAAADDGILGEWDIVSLTGDAIGEDGAEMLDMIKAMGGTMTIEFTETEMIMKAVVFGQTTQDAIPYTIVGNEITIDGDAVPYTLDGNTLTIADEEACMVLQRVGTVAETETAETAEVLWEEGSILGPWDVVEFYGDEDAAQSMELIKSMGGTVTVNFTETEMILAMSIFGETMEEVTEYVIVGDTIVAADGEPVHFVLDGTTLTIGSEDEYGMLLQRPEIPVENVDAVEVTETADDDGSIIGKWNLVETVGEGPTGQYFDMGAEVEVEFTETEMILTVSIFGYTESVNIPIEIKADQIVFEDVAEMYEIEGNTLTLYEATETLIFERK